jgi:hypothetical protein
LGWCQNHAGEKIHRCRPHQALPRLPKNPQPQTRQCGGHVSRLVEKRTRCVCVGGCHQNSDYRKAR